MHTPDDSRHVEHGDQKAASPDVEMGVLHQLLGEIGSRACRRRDGPLRTSQFALSVRTSQLITGASRTNPPPTMAAPNAVWLRPNHLLKMPDTHPRQPPAIK